MLALVIGRRHVHLVRAAQSTEDLKDKGGQAGGQLKEKAAESGEVFKSNVAQLLGVRGGEQTADKWKIRLQLTKPVTWVPLIWGAPISTALPPLGSHPHVIPLTWTPFSGLANQHVSHL